MFSRFESSSRGGRLDKAGWGAIGILVLLTFATYWNSLRVPFFFDDPVAILHNPSIRNLGDIGQVLSPPRNGSGVTGRPVVNLSLAINYALGGTKITGYHITNIVFHLSAGLLLFGCVRRTLTRSAPLQRFRPVALPFAFLTAGLWLLHPLQTESVTCVIQRTELLVGLFYLLTLYSFIRAVEQSSRGWSMAAIASCLFGMASKEVMVSAPLLILLYDRTFIAGTFSGAWNSRRRLHLGLAATWLLLGAILVSVGGTRGQVGGFNVGVSWWAYALKQCEAIVLYLWLTVWPHPLNVFYGVDVVTNPVEVWWQLMLLIALVAGACYALWRKPVLGFCAGWFFAILAPSSSVVPLVSQTVSEHRMYLPLAAPLVLGMGALFALASRRTLLGALGCIAAYGVISARRNVDYHSELAIWSDTVAKAPQNARARINLGAALKNAGDTAGALTQYQAGLQLDPTMAEGFNNVATLQLDAGQPAAAIESCQAALRLRPNFSLAHSNLGMALAQVGRTAEGISHFQTALSLNPDLTEAHYNLSSALLSIGQNDQALVHAEAAIRLNPNIASVHFNLSNALLARNDRARAVLALETAVRINPGYAEAHSNLGSLYYQQGEPARAIPHFEAALRSKPDFLGAHNNLASALSQTGKVDQAVEHYRAAIRLQPSYAEAHFNLGLVLSRLGRNTEAIAAYAEALRLRPDDERAKNELARLRSSQSAPAPRQ
jgi:tetratricopeptide (TPR) repeat protein